MSKLNCWEYKNCNKICSGSAADGKEACPVTKAEYFHGINSGKNGGRMCWYAKKTLSDRKDKGPQAAKCSQCGFYNEVEKEEGSKLVVFF
jgi:hypothetical protein